MLYSMDELKAKLNAILQAENPGVTSEILIDLQNNYSGTLSELAELQERAKKLEADNADLVLANGKLFQSVGVAKEKPKEEPAEEEEQATVEEVLEKMLEGGK